MSINIRAKGASGERQFAAEIQDWAGVRLIRNLEQTRSGGHDLIVHPDETGHVADAFRQLAIECKRYQTATDAQIKKWWQQTLKQANEARLMPILAYKADRQAWRVVVPMSAVNRAMTQSMEIDFTATLSIRGFCHLMVESV